MTAVSGSSIQPSFSHSLPNWNQPKLKDSMPSARLPRTCAKATRERRKESTMDPIARQAAGIRLRCFSRAPIPAASIGNAGMSHRFFTIQFIESQRTDEAWLGRSEEHTSELQSL